MPKVEEILKREQAKDKWKPRDSVGNELFVGDFVCLGQNCNGPLFAKVIAIEPGGLHTPNGPMPTRFRVVADIMLLLGEGQWHRAVVKVVNPAQESLIAAAMDGKLPGS